MSPKPSDTSIKADELALEVKKRLAEKRPGIWGVSWADVTNLRTLLWRRLTKEERKFVVLRVQGVSLWISTSDKSKRVLPENKYKELLRRAMVHIDDEKLYDEIMEAVYGK